MIWTFFILIIVVSVAVIVYPLFCSKLQRFELPATNTLDFSQADAWLSALGDLEDDYMLGRIPKQEYQQQKIILQRSYLKWQEKSANTAD
ncbi:MAG: c-type cytochrome biogenesis protein CcmI [SAR324 cluster bacterium]|nr:c-type cytochrome biogenesis protein CcmI [SAR324 cluster bacterium]